MIRPNSRVLLASLLVLSALLVGCGGFNGVLAPTLSSISPTTVAAGSAAFTITATGSNFVAGTTILWDGTPLTTTVSSATQMTAQVSAAQIAQAGTVTIRAMKPDSTTSGALTLTITGSGTGGSFSLTSISPSTVASGSADFTLTATGIGFVSGATITANGTALTTTFDSATQLHATVPAADVVNASVISIGVTNPDKTTTNTLPLTVTGNTVGTPPTLTSLSPNTSPNGITTPLPLTATGTGFVSGAQIMWNGVAQTTTFVSSTQLTATIPVTYFTSADVGTSEVYVLNPDSSVSNELPFTITISDLTTPGLVTIFNQLGTQRSLVGDPAFTLTLCGNLFANGAVAYWGNTALTTTAPVAATAPCPTTSTLQMTAQVPASDLTAVAEIPVTVQNSPGKSSNPIPYYVGINILFDEVSDVVFDPRQNLLYISKPSTANNSPNSVLAISPLHLTGTPTWTYQAPSGSNPDRLALSNDGKYLYVGLDGNGSVQQLALNGSSAPSAGATISLGADPTYGAYHAMDMDVSPIASTTIAVARGVSSANSSLLALGGVAVYDNATQRANTVGYSDTTQNLLDTLKWSADGTTIYAANNEKDSGDLYQLAVSSSGVSLTSDTPGVFANPNLFIHYDATNKLIYGDDGAVVDPTNLGGETGFSVGTGVLVPDSTLGNAYFVGQSADAFGTVAYLAQAFSLTTMNQVASLNLYNVQGIPQHMIRFHLTNGTPADGLAFSTRKLTNCVVSPCSVGDGRLYIIFLPF